VYRHLCEVPIIWSDLNETCFSRHIFEKNSNFIYIRPAGAQLFHADGQTDMMKLTVVFRNFVNAPKKGNMITCC